MAELNGGGDAELGEAAQVLLGQELGVLDPLAQSERRPLVAGLLERVERLAVGEVADRVHGDRPARAHPGADDLGQLLPARDLHARPVEQPSGLRTRASRP